MATPATNTNTDKAGQPQAELCKHCGLPTNSRPSDQGAPRDEAFCCAGCERVYEFLHANNLENYYRISDDPARPPDSGRRDYSEFDTDDFLKAHCVGYPKERASDAQPDEPDEPNEPDELEITLYIPSLHCTACVWLLERMPSYVAGVIEARVDFGRSLLRLRWTPGQVKLSTLAQKLDHMGYPPAPNRDQDRLNAAKRESRAMLLRLAVAGASAGNVMLLAAALYAGMFDNMAADVRQWFRVLSFLLAVPAVLFSASLFYRGAFRAIRLGAFHMDLPITLGILSGFIWGTVNTLRGTGEIYFDTVTALIFLLLVGRWLQTRQTRRLASASQLLYSLLPSVAHKRTQAGFVDIPIESVQPDMNLIVRSGELVPVDGYIVKGESTIDRAILSGESVPVAVRAQDTIDAGSLNLSGLLHMRASSTGENTRIGQIANLVQTMANDRPRTVRAADRAAHWLVGIALTLAVATIVIWSFYSWERGLENAIALLIITCPCALGLATPLAYAAALSKAAKQGFLISNADALSSLTRPGTLFIDKTGTLTEGNYRVVEWIGDSRLQPLVAALETDSNHPVAVAIRSAYPSELRPQTVTETIGGGIVGTIDGDEVCIGAPQFVDAHARLPDHMKKAVSAVTRAGLTPVVVARIGADNDFACIGLGDPIRQDARDTLDTLGQQGWRIKILSGDHQEVVQRVGHQVGLASHDCRGGLSPEDKASHVTAARKQGTVVMVGDGVNDAAALAAASCGIAVAGSAQASVSVADIYCKNRGVAPLATLVRGAQNTMATVRRNLAFSLIYNIVGATAAMAGALNPLIAAIAMPISSLTVITSSFRGKTFKPRRKS